MAGGRGQTGTAGRVAFRANGKEIGHLHGDRVAHFGFPKDVGAELHEQGRIGPHPVAPDKVSWGSRALESTDDVNDVIALMRLNYDRVTGHSGG